MKNVCFLGMAAEPIYCKEIKESHLLKYQDSVNSGFQGFCYWEHQVLLWLRAGRQSHTVLAIWLYMNSQKQRGLMKLEACVSDPETLFQGSLFIVSLNKNSTAAISATCEDFCLTSMFSTRIRNNIPKCQHCVWTIVEWFGRYIINSNRKDSG